MMDMIRKAVSAELKAAEEGVIEAIVSVFNLVDRGDDIVRPGAFKASLSAKLPNFVWSHDWDRPVGKTLAAEELEPGDSRLPESIRPYGGLWVKGQFNLETQRGREAYADLKFGAVQEFSIGFRIIRDAYDRDNGIREILEAELFEWSPVLVGMNPATTVISVKGEPQAGRSLCDQADAVLAAADALVDRLQGYAEMRARDQRRVSPARIEQAKALIERLQRFVSLGDKPEVHDLRKTLLRNELWRQKL